MNSHLSRMLRPVVAAAGILLMVSASGCSKAEVELGEVRGKVTLDGKPVQGVFIVFQPDGRRPALSLLNKDGEFHLQYNVKNTGTVVGKQGVFLRMPLDDQMDEVRASGIDEPTKVPEKFLQIFETLDVKSGRNEFKLDLKSSWPVRYFSRPVRYTAICLHPAATSHSLQIRRPSISEFQSYQENHDPITPCSHEPVTDVPVFVTGGRSAQHHLHYGR